MRATITKRNSKSLSSTNDYICSKLDQRANQGAQWENEDGVNELQRDGWSLEPPQVTSWLGYRARSGWLASPRICSLW